MVLWLLSLLIKLSNCLYIVKLNRSRIISLQRARYVFKFYKKGEKHDYRNVIQTDLKSAYLRSDSPEFEEKD